MDLSRAGAFVADRDMILEQQAFDGQRPAVEIPFGVGEGHRRVEQLRRGVDDILVEGDGRREAVEDRRIVGDDGDDRHRTCAGIDWPRRRRR